VNQNGIGSKTFFFPLGWKSYEVWKHEANDIILFRILCITVHAQSSDTKYTSPQVLRQFASAAAAAPLIVDASSTPPSGALPLAGVSCLALVLLVTLVLWR